MKFEIKNFDELLGLDGFSDSLLKNHFILYQGYVNNTNKLIENLKLMLLEDKQTALEFAELKRRFSWEFNGMRLHELYFKNLKKGTFKLNSTSKLFKKIIEDFGSYENWEKDFKATGTMRGIGWVVLVYDKVSNILFNNWINEHDAGHLVNSSPLLVMDVFEHAFMLDYGIKKADYISSFFKNINWDEVEIRFS